MFDLGGIYNCENDRIWIVNGEEANRRGGKKQQGKIAEKVMVWLAVWSGGAASLVLFENGTLDHHHYIKEVLCLLLYDTETVNLEITAPSNKTTE